MGTSTDSIKLHTDSFLDIRKLNVLLGERSLHAKSRLLKESVWNCNDMTNDFCIFLNSKIDKKHLVGLEYVLLKSTSRYILYINEDLIFVLVRSTPKKARIILQHIKNYDTGIVRSGSYDLRKALLHMSNGQIKSYEAYTYPDTSNLKSKDLIGVLLIGDSWLPERRRMHAKVLIYYFTNCVLLSSFLEKKIGRGVYCVRGNVASGKSWFVNNVLLKKDEIGAKESRGVINPDFIKKDIIEIEKEFGNYPVSLYQVHSEASMLTRILMQKVRGVNLSYVLDKRMHELQDIDELIKDAKERKISITLYDFDVPLELSCLRILCRPSLGGADPTPDFAGLVKSYILLNSNRPVLLDAIEKNKCFKRFFLIKCSLRTPQAVIASKIGGRYKIDSRNKKYVRASCGYSYAEINKNVKNILLSDRYINNRAKLLSLDDVEKQCLIKYRNLSLGIALKLHSFPEQNNTLSKSYYFNQAKLNLKNTSRTINGNLDLSSSPDKIKKINAALNHLAVGSIAIKNTINALGFIYDNRYVDLSSPDSTRKFIERIAEIVNVDILKDGVLIREKTNSNKFYYLRVEDLKKFMEIFYAQLYRKLHSPDFDVIELAAWTEWNVDLVGHFFADGCGRTAKLISTWVLMRFGKTLPDFTRGVNDMYRNPRESYYRQFGLQEYPKKILPYSSQGYKIFLDYYRTLIHD